MDASSCRVRRCDFFDKGKEDKKNRKENTMNILQQFQNIVDPSTTLGAFLISLVAGVIGSLIVGFFSGRRYEASIHKKNMIKAEGAGAISQDVRKAHEAKNIEISKSNTISVGSVTGEIRQDVEE